MIKAIGFALIILSGVLLSLKTQDEYKKRIEELEAFLESIKLLKTEMVYLKTPVCEIFEKAAESNHRLVGHFFRFLAEGVKAGKPLKETWNAGLSQYELLFHLNQKDLRILSDFSGLLGQTDLTNQLDNIDHVTERLSVQLQNAQKEKEKNAKPQGTLYVAGAFVVGILLL